MRILKSSFLFLLLASFATSSRSNSETASSLRGGNGGTTGRIRGVVNKSHFNQGNSIFLTNQQRFLQDSGEDPNKRKAKKTELRNPKTKGSSNNAKPSDSDTRNKQQNAALRNPDNKVKKTRRPRAEPKSIAPKETAPPQLSESLQDTKSERVVDEVELPTTEESNAGKRERPKNGNLRPHGDRKQKKQKATEPPQNPEEQTQAPVATTTAPIVPVVEEAETLPPTTGAPTSSATAESVTQPTQHPTWTFTPKVVDATTAETSSTCNYCENGCFDDDATVVFSNGSSASCKKAREVSPSLTSSQCEIQRPAVEDNCCSCPTEETGPEVVVGGRLDDKGNSCSFCTDDQIYNNDSFIQFSSGNDSVSCGGFMDIVNSGLQPAFCVNEKVNIEKACCEVKPVIGVSLTSPPTLAPIALVPPIQSETTTAEAGIEKNGVLFNSTNTNLTGAVQVENGYLVPMDNFLVFVTTEQFTELQQELQLQQQSANQTPGTRPGAVMDGTETDKKQPAVDVKIPPGDGIRGSNEGRPSTIKDGGKRDKQPIGSAQHTRPSRLVVPLKTP